MTERDHSFLAPSNAWRWRHCALAPTMEQRYPQEQGGEAAEGDLAHDLAADMLRGETVDLSVLPDDLQYAVQMYVDREREVPAGAEEGIEWQVTATSIHQDCYGTADRFVYVPGVSLRVPDFKTGWKIVEAYENPQLIIYAQGIIDGMSAPPPDDMPVTLRIHQHRPYHPEGPVREWRTTVRALRGYVRDLAAAALEATSDNPTATTGDHCYRCPGRHACKALRAAGLEVAEAAQAPATLELPNDALGFELTFLRAGAALLKQRISGLEQEAEAKIRRGEAVAGWRYEGKPGSLAWTLPVEQIRLLGEMYGADLIKPPEPVTPAQAIKAKLPKEVVEKYSERKPSSLSLVPAPADARRIFGGNAAPVAAGVFTPVPQE